MLEQTLAGLHAEPIPGVLPEPVAYRGYFGIGVINAKKAVNVGTLLRSAHAFGARFIFTVGRRYAQQSSDTTKAWRHVPLFNFADLDALLEGLPFACELVGVELDERAVRLPAFKHPARALYLLGAEDNGLSEEVRERCHALVQVPGPSMCLNVATAGSIVLYDRFTKAVTL